MLICKKRIFLNLLVVKIDIFISMYQLKKVSDETISSPFFFSPAITNKLNLKCSSIVVYD